MGNKQEHITDQQLVQKVLAGNRLAFGLIIQQTEGLVTQMVFRMIPVAADRKDIAQDIYLKVYKNLPGFLFRSKLSTWIGQIAYNTCLHYLEKKRLVLVADHFPGDEDLPETSTLERLQQQEGAANNIEPEVLFNTKALSAILHTALEQLPPLYKTLITLFHQEELSIAEICDITGLPEGTVKSYLSRARKLLKEHLLKNYKRTDL